MPKRQEGRVEEVSQQFHQRLHRQTKTIKKNILILRQFSKQSKTIVPVF